MAGILLTFGLLLSYSMVLNAQIETHIVGGSDTSSFKIPFQVSLRRRSSSSSAYQHACGGSLLAEDTILTAAHCVYNRAATDFLVVAGADSSEAQDGVISRVDTLLPHELYNASITDNDIALIFISPPLPITNIKIGTIELATAQPAVGSVATVSGWGDTAEDGDRPTKLQEVQVSLLESTLCQSAYYWRPINQGMLCAGDLVQGGRDACVGDSGGPLVLNDELVGIVSFGLGCARSEFPSVYANVAYYRNWIGQQRAAHALERLRRLAN